MATAEHEGIIYARDYVHGTIYLTIDNRDPIAINFFHGIKIRIILGVTQPECELERLLPESNLCSYIKKPMKVTIGALAKKSFHEIASFKESMHAYTEHDKIVHKNDVCQVYDIREFNKPGEFNESLVHCEETKVFDAMELKVPHTNLSAGVKCDVECQSSDNMEDASTSEPENTFYNMNEKGLSSSKRKVKRSFQHRKQKVVNLKKVEMCRSKDKKEQTSNVDVKPNKMAFIKENMQQNLGLKKKSAKPKTQSDQQKEKHGAKWKLACQVSCPYCLKYFDNQKAFYDHRKISRSEEYACYICTKVFQFKAHLQAHISACHEREKVSNMKESSSCICNVCGAEVKNLFALKKHLMFHTQEYIYCCCICGRQFVEHGSLSNHMSSHKSGGMIRCKCCDQLFVTRGALAKHKLTSMEVKCHICDEVFPNKTSRTQHYKVVHQNDILKCSKCTNMFSSNEELSVHMKKHNLYKKKQCKTCGKFFSRLEKHIITHKAKAEIDESEFFVCDKCPKKYINRSTFQRHLTIHSQDKPYQCPSCPRRFADSGALRKHLRRHLSLMPYVCEVCGKKCKEPGNLKVHMRIHSDTKHFQCHMCPHAFNYKSSLEGHMKSRHSQNMISASVLSQIPAVKKEYNRVEHAQHQIYRPIKTDQDPCQISKVSSWKMKLPNQSLSSAIDIDMKQYSENRPNEFIDAAYEINNINTIGPVDRLTFHDNSMHVRSLGLDVATKHTFVESSVNLNLSSAYSFGGNPVINGQSNEESSISVTSLDIATMNVSSTNVNLYR